MNDTLLLQDEVRCGFYIPTAIKQVWALALDVLREIDRICTKYDIDYFADWGTLLGTVRHGGFIPWDDDLDIGMKRDDYIRFLSVAKRELPSGYVIHDFRGKKDHWLFLSRVVNNDKMCFDDEYLASHYNCPWLVGVDIFIKDYLYMDDYEEKCRDDDIMRLIALADGVVAGDMDASIISSNLSEISAKYFVSFPRYYDNCDDERARSIAVMLYDLAEKRMSELSGDKTDRIGQIFPWILKGGAAEDKADYESFIRLPFENTTIPVPVNYHRILTKRYGNYTTAVKMWSGHDYPAFEGQKQEMEALAGEKMFEWTFTGDMLDDIPIDRSASLKTIARECLGALDELISTAALNDAQTIAVDLGTLMEQAWGEDNVHCISVVSALQDFCDALWQDYQAIESAKRSEAILSKDELSKLSDVILSQICDRREILILPIGPSHWSDIESIASGEYDDKTDISIVPLPLLNKDIYGNVNMSESEIEAASQLDGYPNMYQYRDWTKYDISLHCPDTIYIQNPYDETNPYTTIPSDYYSVNLRRYTDNLIYIPIGRVDDFDKDDWNDYYNLKHYVIAPGVIYADKVYVCSETVRLRYIDKLVDYGGESTKHIWEEKITVRSEVNEDNIKSTDDKKRLLYCIGANELYESRDKLVDIITRRLEVIGEASDSVTMGLAIYPGDKEQWGHIDVSLANDFFDEVDKLRGEGVELIDVATCELTEVAKRYDAYYGSPSPLVVEFSGLGKPVMLCDYTIEV